MTTPTKARELAEAKAEELVRDATTAYTPSGLQVAPFIVDAIREALLSFAAEARREALEEAAKVAEKNVAEREVPIAKGRGEWPNPDYVTDYVWASWSGAAMEARDILRRLRALATRDPEAE